MLDNFILYLLAAPVGFEPTGGTTGQANRTPTFLAAARIDYRLSSHAAPHHEAKVLPLGFEPR